MLQFQCAMSESVEAIAQMIVSALFGQGCKKWQLQHTDIKSNHLSDCSDKCYSIIVGPETLAELKKVGYKLDPFLSRLC